MTDSTPSAAACTAGPASLVRRLLAMIYDSLLVTAVLMFTTAAYMGLHAAALGAETYRSRIDSGTGIGDPLLTLTLFLSLYLFFGWFWTRDGQTLGMQVWRIRVQNRDGSTIGWRQSLIRIGVATISAAMGGLGYLWLLIDRKGRTWQCIASGTEVVRLTKPEQH
jgi:uncharacterized RDD family membrane protein YckC